MDDTPPNIHLWNTSFHNFILNGKLPPESFTLLEHVISMKTECTKDTMLLLGSISNYHWWQYTRCDGQKSSSNIHVNLHDHLLYHPSCEDNDDNLRVTYFPKSPRNRLMYYIHAGNLYEHSMAATITQLLKIDIKEECAVPQNQSDNEETEPPRKKRKYSPCILKVTPEMLCTKMQLPIEGIKNSCQINNTIYHTFSEQVVTNGTIKWRVHSQTEDTVLMNDYSSSTGSLSLTSFVHVTQKQSQSESETFLLKCTCDVYKAIQSAATSNNSEDVDTNDIVLDHSLTCMHCQFFREFLSKYIVNWNTISSSSAIDSKVKESQKEVNNPITVVGIPNSDSTTKLSVLSEDSLSIIHITFKHGTKCFANCQNGECKARLLNKKKVPKATSIQNTENLCGHIHTLFANLEILEKHFPHYFNSTFQDNSNSMIETESYSGSEDISQGTINTEDNELSEATSTQVIRTLNICKNATIYDCIISYLSIYSFLFILQANQYFYPATSTWTFPSRSSHKPKEMNDLHLSQ